MALKTKIQQQASSQNDPFTNATDATAQQLLNLIMPLGKMAATGIGNGLALGGDVIQQGLQNTFNPQVAKTQAKTPLKPALQKMVLDASTTPSATQTPTPTPTPSPYQQYIAIGMPNAVPPNIAQPIMNSFDDIHQATNAARVLSHPMSNSFIPGDPQSNNHMNMGENGSFKTNNIDIRNSDGSIDRGLFRINSNTFNGLISRPDTKAALQAKGITSWDDMNDPQKNADAARLIYNQGGWERWFAAPKDLRLQNPPQQ